MSGAFTPYVTIDDRALMRKLGTLSKRASGLAPCLKNIGKYKVEATQEYFDKQQDPQGVKWAALSTKYKDKKKHPKILTENGLLRDLIHDEVKNGILRIGTDRKYAATHQFGRDKMPAHMRKVTKVYGRPLKFPVWASVRAYNPRIPARPFLGWNSADQKEIRGIVADFLEMD